MSHLHADEGPPVLLLHGTFWSRTWRRKEDEFQPVGYAERFEREMPNSRLVAVPGARHIPMEDDPERIGDELARFFGGRLP